MRVAIISGEIVVSVNDYPAMTDIHELDGCFIENYEFVDVTDISLPEITSAVDTLRYANGAFVVVHGEESVPTQLDNIEANVTYIAMMM